MYQSNKVETRNSGERIKWHDKRGKSDEVQELQCAANPRQLLRHFCYAACLIDLYRRRGFFAVLIDPIPRVGDCNFSLYVYIYEPIKHVNNHNNKMKSVIPLLVPT